MSSSSSTMRTLSLGLSGLSIHVLLRCRRVRGLDVQIVLARKLSFFCNTSLYKRTHTSSFSFSQDEARPAVRAGQQLLSSAFVESCAARAMRAPLFIRDLNSRKV
ncbi:MAG: hypothetical protein LZF62_410099 [Nitrospira sp.]|nr:MAG: hypothetical protein LZF62_410099 [Nitrospira sp.]